MNKLIVASPRISELTIFRRLIDPMTGVVICPDPVMRVVLVFGPPELSVDQLQFQIAEFRLSSGVPQGKDAKAARVGEWAMMALDAFKLGRKLDARSSGLYIRIAMEAFRLWDQIEAEK